jgi:hypothetical protein
MPNSPSTPRPHLGHPRSRLFTTHYPRDGSATTLPSPRRSSAGTNLIAPPPHSGTSLRRDPASGPPNQRPQSTKNANVPLRPAHQLHHFQRTMSWPQRDRMPNTHQHMNTSPLFSPRTATHPKISHLAHQPSDLNRSTSTRTMNSLNECCGRIEWIS